MKRPLETLAGRTRQGTSQWPRAADPDTGVSAWGSECCLVLPSPVLCVPAEYKELRPQHNPEEHIVIWKRWGSFRQHADRPWLAWRRFKPKQAEVRFAQNP